MSCQRAPHSTDALHPRCRVCGNRSLRIDEVFHRELLLLAECGRCSHRWTHALPDSRPAARLRRVGTPSRAAAARPRDGALHAA